MLYSFDIEFCLEGRLGIGSRYHLLDLCLAFPCSYFCFRIFKIVVN